MARLAVLSAPPPEPAADRADLIAAVAAATQAAAVLAAAQAAERHGGAMVQAALAEIAAAEEAVAEARDSAAADLVAAAASCTILPPAPAMRAARDRVNTAADILDTHRAALVELKQAVADAQKRAERAKELAATAARSVFHQAAVAALEGTEAAQAELARKRLALKWIMEQRLLTGTDETRRALALLNNPEEQLPTLYGSLSWPQLQVQAEVVAHWQGALAALTTDPLAELPQ